MVERAGDKDEQVFRAISEYEVRPGARVTVR